MDNLRVEREGTLGQRWRLASGRGILSAHLVTLAAYTVITVIMTYPVATQLITHIAVGGDAFWFTWQFWWVRLAILDRGQLPFVTDLIYHPLTDVPISLQTPFNEIFMLPLQVAVGSVVQYNLLFLSTYILSGYVTYLLAFRLLGRRDLAFIAGLIFSFSAYRTIHGGHISLLTTQWLPLCLLLLINYWTRPTVKRGLLAGIGIGLVALSSPYYVAYFLVPAFFIGAIYLLVWQWTGLRRRELWRALPALFLSASLLGLPFAWTLLRAGEELHEAALAAASSVYVYSADILSWILPTTGHRMWEALWDGAYSHFAQAYLNETSAFFGFLPPLLAFASLLIPGIPRRQLRFWQLLAFTCWILAFGPVLKLWTEPLVEWMPYRLLMELPGFYAFRVPGRLSVTVILAATILAMLVLKQFMLWKPHLPWPALLVGWSFLLLFNLQGPFPYPTELAAVPAVYQEIAATPGDFAILELPGGELYQNQMSRYMHYQTQHEKRLVSGYLGRRPERLHRQEYTMPFVSRFFSNDWGLYFGNRQGEIVDWPDEQTVLSDSWPVDIRNAQALLDSQQIRYVVVHDLPSEGDYSESAALLLSQGLGLPKRYDGPMPLYLFEIEPAAQTTRGRPLGLDFATLRYDSSFSAPFLSHRLPTRQIEPQVDQESTVTFSIPVSGMWEVHGFLSGELAADITFEIDGIAVTPATLLFPNGWVGFSISRQFGVGNHTLVLQVPEAHLASSEGMEDQACQRLCLGGLVVHIKDVSLDAHSPVAVFVDEGGNQFTLLDIYLVSFPPEMIGDADPLAYLVTLWDPASGQQPLDAENYPVMYVHIFDEAGNKTGQADHRLAEISLHPRDSGQFVDMIEILTSTGSSFHHIELGLWQPAEGKYLWLQQAISTSTEVSLIFTAAELEVEHKQIGNR
jgi:hypothetical protein